MSRRRLRVSGWAALGVCFVSVAASGAGGASSVKSTDLREWLAYIASDELQGRAVYSTGLGLAAAYLEKRGA